MLIYANIQTSGDSLSYLLLLNTLNQNIKVANLGCIMLWQSIYMHKRTVLPCVAVGEVVCRGVVVVWRVHVVLCFIAFCAVSCLALFSVILFAHYPNNSEYIQQLSHRQSDSSCQLLQLLLVQWFLSSKQQSLQRFMVQ